MSILRLTTTTDLDLQSDVYEAAELDLDDEVRDVISRGILPMFYPVYDDASSSRILEMFEFPIDEISMFCSLENCSTMDNFQSWLDVNIPNDGQMYAVSFPPLSENEGRIPTVAETIRRDVVAHVFGKKYGLEEPDEATTEGLIMPFLVYYKDEQGNVNASFPYGTFRLIIPSLTKSLSAHEVVGIPIGGLPVHTLLDNINELESFPLVTTLNGRSVFLTAEISEGVNYKEGSTFNSENKGNMNPLFVWIVTNVYKRFLLSESLPSWLRGIVGIGGSASPTVNDYLTRVHKFYGGKTFSRSEVMHANSVHQLAGRLLQNLQVIKEEPKVQRGSEEYPYALFLDLPED
ncbi:MAG: hypothetical protein Fur003_0440 [Candidatus Dojkabacteria bacterium]